jgi:hypothetical protein
MTEYRDLSKLPDDAAYWDVLESRILAGLAVRSGADAAPGWSSPLASRAWRLGGLAAAAVLAALLFTPGRSAPAAGGWGLVSLPEGDPALHALVSAPAPPPLAALLLPGAGSSRSTRSGR